MLGNHPYSRLAVAMVRVLLWTTILADFFLVIVMEKERLVPYDYEPNTYHYVSSAEPNSPELFRLQLILEHSRGTTELTGKK